MLMTEVCEMEAHHPHQHQHHPESEPVRTKTQPLQEVIHRRTPGARLWLIKEASSIPALSCVLSKSSTGSRLWLKASRLEPNLPARWFWNSEPSKRQWCPIWTPLTWPVDMTDMPITNVLEWPFRKRWIAPIGIHTNREAVRFLHQGVHHPEKLCFTWNKHQEEKKKPSIRN